MRTIDELGISPSPWDRHKQFVMANDDGSVVAATNERDARLIAAAPELYEALREAIVEKCEECHAENDYVSSIDIEWNMCKCCKAKKWRDALMKASGEGVAK